MSNAAQLGRSAVRGSRRGVKRGEKRASPGLFYRLFSSFQTNVTILVINNCKNCQSSIRCWDMNPRPSEHVSPHITT